MPVFKDEQRKTYYVKLYYTDWTGQRRQKLKRGFDKSKDAKAWEREFLEKQQGTPDMTFKALADLYTEDMKVRNKESSTYVKTALINAWLIPSFGEKPINAITPADVRKWQSELVNGRNDRKISSGHITNIEKLFNAIMNYAVKFYKLPVNPHSITGYACQVTRRKMQFWTQEEFSVFLNSITDPVAYMAFETLFYAGMRVGELLALTLNDIDFINCSITISKTYSPKNKGDQITSPKTRNSYRTIIIPRFLCDSLKKYSECIYDINKNERLFPVLPELIRRRLNSGCKKSGIKTIRIHDIRHSHVSMLIDMGFSPHLIAERIGDTVDMVNNVYGHLYPNRHNEVAEELQKIVSKQYHEQ